MPAKVENIKAFPNPFTESMAIRFAIDDESSVKLEIYNSMGQKVAELFNARVKANQVYTIEFKGQGLKSGVYFYKLSTKNKFFTGRIMKLE